MQIGAFSKHILSNFHAF